MIRPTYFTCLYGTKPPRVCVNPPDSRPVEGFLTGSDGRVPTQFVIAGRTWSPANKHNRSGEWWRSYNSLYANLLCVYFADETVPHEKIYKYEWVAPHLVHTVTDPVARSLAETVLAGECDVSVFLDRLCEQLQDYAPLIELTYLEE